MKQEKVEGLIDDLERLIECCEDEIDALHNIADELDKLYELTEDVDADVPDDVPRINPDTVRRDAEDAARKRRQIKEAKRRLEDGEFDREFLCRLRDFVCSDVAHPSY